MSMIRKNVESVGAEAVVLLVGWLVCISVLAGAYTIGRWAAPHLGWEYGADTLGLLSAVTILWLYEHRNAEGKYERLCELIARHGRAD